MQKNDIAISIRGLYKSFKQTNVLQGVDVSVQKGSVFCLLGSNGAGKTTMVRILSTLLPADKGRVTVGSYDLKKSPQKVREIISLTGQYAAVDELLTGRENLYLAGRLFHMHGYRERAEQLLAQFELTTAAGQRTGTYSGGMRRKLDIAMSLMGRPQILFLDEPTTGLDPQNRIAMWEEIENLKNDGTTIFLTTQYLEEAEQLADHVAILNQGVVDAQGTVEELKSLLPGGAVEFVFGQKQIAAAMNLLPNGTVEHNEKDAVLTVMTDGSVNAFTDLLVRLRDTGIEAKSAAQKQPTLEDVYLNRIQNGKDGGAS